MSKYSPTTAALLGLLAILILALASERAGADERPVYQHAVKVDWQAVKMRGMFERCRDVRGGDARRACEADYAAFIEFQDRRARATIGGK